MAHTVGISGQSLIQNANAPNFGSLYVMLKDFDERRGPALSADEIAAQLRQDCQQQTQDALVSIFGAPPIDGLGTTGGFKIMIEDRGHSGLVALQQVCDEIVGQANQTPGIQGVSHTVAGQYAVALPGDRSQ